MHKVAGTYRPEYGRPVRVEVSASIKPAQMIGVGQTITHEPIPTDALEVSITADLYEGSRDIGGGQAVGELRLIGTPWALEVVELWDRWHLNGMRALCAHQGETWQCTNVAAHYPNPIPAGEIVTAGPVTNGWSIVRETYGDHAYPHRGDSCHVCGRDRWNEPTDACSETGYRAGTAWLFEAVPSDVLARLRELFA